MNTLEKTAGECRKPFANIIITGLLVVLALGSFVM
jgi:hypothetical protein